MKKEKRTVKVTEKKLADGVIKLDCEATAIEVNNALKEAAEAFARFAPDSPKKPSGKILVACE